MAKSTKVGNYKRDNYSCRDADDPATLYLREIGAAALLKPEEEKVLARHIEIGEKQTAQSAKEKLVKHNLRLVVSIAKKYINRGVPFLDLVQEGNIGLLKAIDRFDYKRGYRLSTYASWWIKQSITRAIIKQSRTIRLPEYVISIINRITKTSRKLVQENGCEPTPEEIANATRLPLHQIKRILQITEGEVSLNLFTREHESTLSDFPEDREVISPVDTLANSKLQAQTNQALARLQPEEAEVLRMRYGLGKETIHTLEEVGRNLNLSREKIRQIETRALRKLKNMGETIDYLPIVTPRLCLLFIVPTLQKLF